jgi:hypothetical protein
MKRAEILERLENALRKRNPLFAENYLLPGLSEKTRAKRFRKLSGGVEPLQDLYSWHDGTKFVHLAADETFNEGIAKVSFFPIDTFLFTDSEQAIGMMHTWEEIAKRRPALKEGVWRFFPLFSGGGARFMLDLDPQEKSRIVFYDDRPVDSFEVAYPTFDAFLADILRANETGERLSFFERGWQTGSC